MIESPDPRTADGVGDGAHGSTPPSNDLIEQAVMDLRLGREREDSFKTLFFAYHDRLLGFFRRRGLTLEEAEDLVQESFIAMETAIRSYRAEAPFNSWFFGLAANVYRRNRRYRSARKRSAQEVPLEAPGDADGGFRPAPLLTADDPSPLEQSIEQEHRQKLRRATDQLPTQMRQCALLHWVEGYETKEVAKLLSLQPATVRVQLFRARRRLRQVLEEASIEPEDNP